MKKEFVLLTRMFMAVFVGGVTYTTAALATTNQAQKTDVPHGWVAVGCGEEPKPPKIDVSTVQHYNMSVDKVSAYEKAARIYNECVSKAAMKEETKISNEARSKITYVHDGSAAVQKRISENFVKLTAALKVGGAKLRKIAQ